MTPATILTVEDDPLVRYDLRQTLEGAGFTVCSSARDGNEAVVQAREHRPDLILMDLGLPNLDGYAATEQILAQQDVAVVALTGRSDSASLDRATRSGAVDHVLKPFSEGELVATVSHVLAERHAARERVDYQLISVVESLVREGLPGAQIDATMRELTGRDRARPGLRLFASSRAQRRRPG